MNQHKKFNSGQENELSHHQTTQNSFKEFANVESLLREDALQTAVPDSLEQRLQKSSADIPQPSRSWWKRLFQ